MLDSRIGRRYAQALFQTALKFDVVSAVEDDLNTIAGLLESDAQFRHFFLAPITSQDEKIKLAEKLFADRVTALTMQVLRVMLEKGRELEIEVVRDSFSQLRRTHEGNLLVHVTSAVDLDIPQRKALIDKLEVKLGKKIEARFSSDSRLIGGVKVAFDSFVLDGSVRGSLNHLRDRLQHDLLKQV